VQLSTDRRGWDQTPLLRFVVDLLCNKLCNKSTTCPQQQIELMEFML